MLKSKEWTFYRGDTVDREITIKAGGIPWPLDNAELRFAAKKVANSSKYDIGPKMLVITDSNMGKCKLELSSLETNIVDVLYGEIEMFNTVSNKRKTIWQGSIVFEQTIIDP